MSEWPFWASLGLKGNFLTVLALWMLLIRILILDQHVNNWSWRSTLSSWDPTMSFLSPCVNGAGGRVRKQELCLVAVAADARKSPARVTACRHWSREQLWGRLKDEAAKPGRASTGPDFPSGRSRPHPAGESGSAAWMAFRDNERRQQ